jgi:hypothetical protein
MEICTPMPPAAVFTGAKMWQQTKCPSTDEQTNNVIFTPQFKRKESLTLAAMWMMTLY